MENEDLSEENIPELAHQILNLFEEMLEETDIIIPSKDREGDPDEARLFGSEYYKLEDKIIKLLKGEEDD